MAIQMARWFADLCKGVAFHVNPEEMRKICADLDIEYDEKISILELSNDIGTAAVFYNRVGKLVDFLRNNRPRVQPFTYQELNWDNINDQADLALRIGDPMLAYLSGPVKIPDKGKYTLWYHQLIDVFTRYYDDNEFRKMCIDLRFNYLLIADLKRVEQAKFFVRLIISEGMVNKAIDYCRRNRPRVQPMWVHDIPWDDIIERSGAAMKSGNPLNDPILAKRIREKH